MKAIIETQQLFADLSKTFTDPYAVIRELLQNGKRAGASKIDIFYEPNTGALEVRNNGAPLADFQDLIHVSHSGWKPSPAGEKPYGLGFLSVIFSSTGPVNIASVSEDRRTMTWLSIDTADLIAGRDIGETQSMTKQAEESRLYQQGVIVSLTVPDLSPSEIKEQVAYFEPNIVITFNEEPVARRQVRYSRKIPQGELHVFDEFTSRMNVRDGNIPISYQGFQTAFQGVKHTHGQGYIVKLDQIVFDARLPDRNFILEYTEEVQEELHIAVEEAFVDIIKNDVPDSELLDSYRFLKSFGMLDILQGIEELPPGMCYTPTDMHGLVYGESSTNDVYSWQTGEAEGKKVYRSDVIIQVDSLVIGEENRDAFYSALLLGGSVCTLWGNTEALSEKERKIPEDAEMLSWSSCSGWEERLANVYVYRDKEDDRWMVFNGADLYLNLENKTHTQIQIHKALKIMSDYEYDYGYREEEHEEDTSQLRFKMEEYIQMEDAENIQFDKLFENFLRTNRVGNMPKAMKSKSFTLTVDSEGSCVLSLTEATGKDN